MSQVQYRCHKYPSLEMSVSPDFRFPSKTLGVPAHDDSTGRLKRNGQVHEQVHELIVWSFVGVRHLTRMPRDEESSSAKWQAQPGIWIQLSASNIKFRSFAATRVSLRTVRMFCCDYSGSPAMVISLLFTPRSGSSRVGQTGHTLLRPQGVRGGDTHDNDHTSVPTTLMT